MRNLLNFLAKYNNLIIFLFLEGFAIYFLITGNHYHKSRVVKSIKGLTRNIEDKVSIARTYFRLQEINTKLATENTELRNRIERLTRKVSKTFISVTDTMSQQQYIYTTAEIVNNSINKQKNFFTINKGTKQGINKDMAVISRNSVAGIVIASSDNFSIVMSLLNLDFRLSGIIKSAGYFGSLNWDGKDYRYALLNDIPQNAVINIGDTVETTNYSAIFPKGIIIGTVSAFEKVGGDFYKISVLLATDFDQLDYVNVISNLKKTEQKTLEEIYR